MNYFKNTKCCLCNSYFYDEIYTCKKDHLVCEECGDNNNLICKVTDCLNILDRKKESPLELAMSDSNNDFDKISNYFIDNRTQLKSEKKLKILIEGSVQCIGATLNVWKCNWTGRPSELKTHFQQEHTDLESFTNFQYAIVPYDENNMISTINVINAYNKNFGFYYKTNNISGLVYFVVFIVDGFKNDIDEFSYEILIQSPVEKYRKIKFVEKCFYGVENVENTIKTEQCLVLPRTVVNNHLYKNNIHFRLFIKPVIGDQNKNKNESQENVQQSKEIKLGNLTRPNGFIFSNKGTIISNTYRKGTTNNRNLLAPLLIGGVAMRASKINSIKKSKVQVPTTRVVNSVRTRK